MLESGVCAAEIVDLWPATGKIDHPFDAMHKFLTNLRFCVSALEFTFDLLHRAVQLSIFGAGRKLVTYATVFCENFVVNNFRLVQNNENFYFF